MDLVCFPFQIHSVRLRLLIGGLVLVVVGIAVVDTIDEAVELANETDYSLTSSIWTKDVNRALDVAGRIRTGIEIPPENVKGYKGTYYSGIFYRMLEHQWWHDV